MKIPDFTCPLDGFGRGKYSGRVQLSPTVQLITYRCTACAGPYSVQAPIPPAGPDREALEAAILAGGGQAEVVPMRPPLIVEAPTVLSRIEEQLQAEAPRPALVAPPEIVELSGPEIDKLEADIVASRRARKAKGVALIPPAERNGRRGRPR